MELEDINLCVLKSSVNLRSQDTQTVVCEACNDVGCNKASFNFLASGKALKQLQVRLVCKLFILHFKLKLKI